MSVGIKKGDRVVILSGKDKGKSGRVLRVFGDTNRVIVEGINLVKKHLKRRSESEPGGIKEIPLALHISNVAFFCPQCNKRTRISVKVLENKNKIRLCKRCQKNL